MAILSDGGALVAGGIQSGTAEQLAVWRFRSDGQLNPGFGNNGRFVLSGSGRATSIVADGGGFFMVGGWQFHPGIGTDAAILRVDAR